MLRLTDYLLRCTFYTVLHTMYYCSWNNVYSLLISLSLLSHWSGGDFLRICVEDENFNLIFSLQLATIWFKQIL